MQPVEHDQEPKGDEHEPKGRAGHAAHSAHGAHILDRRQDAAYDLAEAKGRHGEINQFEADNRDTDNTADQERHRPPASMAGISGQPKLIVRIDER